MASKYFKAIVLGSGQGGTPLTSALAAAGYAVALVESTHLGGTCINEGCTPTKTMVASAKVAYYARRQADFGVRTSESGVKVDMETVRRRKRDIVNSFRGGSEGRLEKAENVTLVKGKARFVGKKEVEVTMTDDQSKTERLTADWIFINVGCRPAPLAVPGAEQIDYLNSTSVMELGVVPEHLVVVGGGYIGVEFAQMFRRFGSRATIIQRGKQLLGREDEDIAEGVKKVLDEDGLEIMLNARPESIKTAGKPTEIEIVVNVAGERKTVTASHVLSAAGRLPNTADLGLDTAGVETGRGGFINVNQKLETNVEGIYALGDVKGGPAFTHISYDDFRVLKANVLSQGTASITDRLVPYTVFMDPQLGRVGLTEDEAKQQGRKVRIAKMPMAWVARALEMDESRGLMKVIVDGESDQILGCAILGIDGGELMSMIEIAMMGKLPYTALRDGIFAHPLLAESLNNLFGTL